MNLDWRDGVVVVGGGAAGLMAALSSARFGARTVLLEKQPRLGTKILISGGGKCNVTHSGTMAEIEARFRQNEGLFLRPSFYRYTNTDFVDLLDQGGLAVYTRPDGRIFPVPPADAHDVVKVLETAVIRAGVEVRLGAGVARLTVGDGRIAGVELTNGSTIQCSRVVLAAGGSSYPSTGTTGDAWKWLASVGHSIVPLRAALAPLYLDPPPPADWSGVALRNCVLRARIAAESIAVGRELGHFAGDLLFTYKGISGPAALGVSRDIADAAPQPADVSVDLLPAETFEALRERLMSHTRRFPRRAVLDWVEEAAPKRVMPALFAAANVDPSVRGAYLGTRERNSLVQTMKSWRLGRVRHVPLERGEVVAGGVSLAEVDPHTMRSRLIDELYLCGELLDIAGPVGGFNLQAAWCTGYVAGQTAGKSAGAHAAFSGSVKTGTQ